jgi:hypothetical protein
MSENKMMLLGDTTTYQLGLAVYGKEPAFILKDLEKNQMI